MNGNIKWIAVALVVCATFCGTLAWAQAASETETASKTEPVDWKIKAKEAISRTYQKYVYQYKPPEEQKAKLEKVLIAQYKDLMDHDKIYAPKIKTIDDQIAAVNEKMAVLKKEVDALAKHKAIYAKVRSELLLDHKAELNNVFSKDQRIANMVAYFKNSAAYRYWGGFSKAQQASLTEQFEAAALKVIQAGPEQSDNVLAAARRELQGVVSKLATPEVRHAGETKYLVDSTVRAFYRVKLTDDQKAKIQQMCDKALKEKSELYAKYQQLDKDRNAIRKSMYKFNSSDYLRKIRDEVTKSVLTEEQRKASTSRYRPSSRRPTRSTTKRPAAPPKTRTPK